MIETKAFRIKMFHVITAVRIMNFFGVSRSVDSLLDANVSELLTASFFRVSDMQNSCTCSRNPKLTRLILVTMFACYVVNIIFIMVCSHVINYMTHLGIKFSYICI